jgi:hypothetical protein
MPIMTVPADQNFNSISGTLGSGSATISGITYYNSDPTAVLSVTSNLLHLGGSAGTQTIAGFKTADGSDFQFTGFDIYGPFGSYDLQGYRDGVLVFSTGFTIAAPSHAGPLDSTFPNVDEIRFIAPDNADLVIDTLTFAAPVVTHLAPDISNLATDVASYTEGVTPIFIDVARDAVVSDPDTFVFNGGSLSIVITNTVSAEDVLAILTGSGVSLSGALANGVTVFVGATAIGTVSSDGKSGHALTIDFNANANAANVSALLEAVTYANTNQDNPDTTARAINTTFSDGDGQSTTVASTVAVSGVNDAPVAAASGGSANYTEGTPIAVDAALTVSDVDSSNLASAAVKITGNRAAGDVLLFTDQHGITGIFDAPTGTLTLTGSASVADYQTALDSIRFGTGDDPGSLTRTVTFTVNDGALDSAQITRTVNVTPVNDAPVATIAPASYAATEQVSLNLKNTGLSVSDADAGNGTETVTLSVAEGTLTVAAGGSGASVLGSGTASVAITGTLAQINALFGADATSTVRYIDTHPVPAVSTQLTMSVTDNGNTGTGGALIASDNATIFITAVNDAPVLNGVPASAGVSQHGPVIPLAPGLTVSDADSTTLAGATVQVSGGTFAGDGDVLAAMTTGTGITASYNAGTETLTLSGTDTLAHYNQVLETVTFHSSSSAADVLAHPTRTIEWQVDDGGTGNHLSIIATTTVTVAKPAAANDFNGNGTSDILWQNTDGTAAIWQMNGTSLVSGANVGVNPGAAWHEIGTGDFNGDGHGDILWQNADGTPMMWLMDGSNAPTVSNVGFNPGPAWHEIGTGDFNGDGKSDILWQNSSGQAAVWLMDGANVLQGSDVGFNPGAAWHVIGAGDFDGDGKADILWQNSNGQAAAWLMDGLNLKSGGNVGFNPGSAWQVQAADDFNGDGKADILWQNKDGAPAVWLMDGFNVLSGANVGFNPGAAWQVHGAADFNGDGKADILWQNTDGTPAVWLMNGTSLISGTNVGFDPGAGWHVVPAHHDLLV